MATGVKNVSTMSTPPSPMMNPALPDARPPGFGDARVDALGDFDKLEVIFGFGRLPNWQYSPAARTVTLISVTMDALPHRRLLQCLE